MLERIIENEYKNIIQNSEEIKEISECEERINNSLGRLKMIDSDLANDLDNEIGSNIYLRSKEYFQAGFKLGLKLACDIKDMSIK